MEYKVKGLNELSEQLHKFQIDAGFTDSNITQRMMLIGSELFEAFEAFRNNKFADIYKYNKHCEDDSLDLQPDKDLAFKINFKDCIKDTFEDELADLFIRLVAFCGENDIDLEKYISLKMRYNALRGHKYGGKKF